MNEWRCCFSFALPAIALTIRLLIHFSSSSYIFVLLWALMFLFIMHVCVWYQQGQQTQQTQYWMLSMANKSVWSCSPLFFLRPKQLMNENCGRSSLTLSIHLLPHLNEFLLSPSIYEIQKAALLYFVFPFFPVAMQLIFGPPTTESWWKDWYIQLCCSIFCSGLDSLEMHTHHTIDTVRILGTKEEPERMFFFAM